MVECNCGCRSSGPQPEEMVQYYCSQCNAIKEAKPGAPRPECCGKKMQEVD